MLDDFEILLKGFDTLAAAIEAYLLSHGAEAEAQWVTAEAVEVGRHAIELAQAALRRGVRW